MTVVKAEGEKETTMTTGTHEDYTRKEDIKVGSERAFGLVFAAVFAVIALLPLLEGGAPRWWASAIAGALMAIAIVAPELLRPFNRLWFQFGMLLHKVVNPLIMGLLFFLTVTPIALIMRLFGKDPLRLRFDPTVKSYWIKRPPPEAGHHDMRNQF